MGEISVAMNDFLRDKRRFADLFNAYCFQGREVVKPGELTEGSEQYGRKSIREGSNKERVELTERRRDLKMFLKNGSVLQVLAIENQNAVDYTMPLRTMEFDCLEYGRQLREFRKRNKENHVLCGRKEFLSGIKRTDKLMPIYTICLYHGEEPWDGPRCLRDMMDFEGDAESWGELFADYPLKLFCVNEQSDFSMLRTELREVFSVLSFRKDKVGLKQLMDENEAFHHLKDDTLLVLSKLLGQPKLWTDREKYMSKDENGEEYNMCQAMRELMEDSKNAGLEEGRQEGRQEIIVLVNKMLQAGDGERIVHLTDESFVQEMCKLYGVNN